MEREEIRQYVTDASIAVKWFVDEADSSRARKLKGLYLEGAINLEAPSLLNYEVASALRFHPVAKLTSSQFRTVMDSLEELQISRDPNASGMDQCANAFPRECNINVRRYLRRVCSAR